MNQLKEIDHAFIHDRARQRFGWTEYGYISADMYYLHRATQPAWDPEPAALYALQQSLQLTGGAWKCFREGWLHWVAEWKAARTPRVKQSPTS